MALSRRSQGRFQNAIWPGFVDAMTGLLLVLMFVLTIFMVIQFVLREQISGQRDELDALTGEVAALSSALGLEQTRADTLATDLDAASAQIDSQASRIAALTAERDATVADLTDAQSRITDFETQVAGLLSDRDAAETQIAGLEAEQERLVSEGEALNLALAEARNEIDVRAEQARLAAARSDALAAMVADLEQTAEADAGRIAALETETAEQSQALSETEAAHLAEAAAAEALRERLANADTELTAMTLALEEKRREAEETLTLLAAAETAREGLDTELAALLLAKQEIEAEAAALETALDATADVQRTADIARETFETQIAELLIENQTLQAELAALSTQNANTGAQAVDLQSQLAAALADAAAQAEALASAEDAAAAAAAEAAAAQALADAAEAEAAELAAAGEAAQASGESAQEEAARQAALLALANRALQDEEALSAESQRQVALLNAQIVELREQVGSLQGLLNLAEEADREANIQIEALGSQLNTALARVAAEERRARALEEAETARLAEEARRLEEEAARLAAEAEAAKEDVQNLEQFRSDFFGQLRQILEGQDRVRIEGDRFVFASEVLFQPGQAELSAQGQAEIANIANILSSVADQIPSGIDWIIRVDGHTDNIPLVSNGRYRNNWELSQGRALSVVRYMSENLGIPPNRLAANGFGEYQPINPADTTEARAQNRRIELKLTER